MTDSVLLNYHTVALSGVRIGKASLKIRTGRYSSVTNWFILSHLYVVVRRRCEPPYYSLRGAPREQRSHGDTLSVTDWIRLSRFRYVRYLPGHKDEFVHMAALLSLSGGWLAISTAESSRLLSLPDGWEIKMSSRPCTERLCGTLSP